jgi:ribosome-associated translation inhibitor RaiA
MTPSPAVEEIVARWVERLEQAYDRIQKCSVVVDQPHKHKHQGRHFQVRIDVSVPGREIAVTRDPVDDGSHEDVYVALSDAFRAARRQLQDHARIQRGA